VPFRFDALQGWEIVDNTARLCVMNLLLHGIGSEETDSPIRVDDALKRFKRFSYDELIQRDKVSLDLVWLRDDSLEDLDNLPPPEVIAQEIVEDLEAALTEFAAIAASLRSERE
jgi:type I restriction-modification system DNA methylase subunit